MIESASRLFFIVHTSVELHRSTGETTSPGQAVQISSAGPWPTVRRLRAGDDVEAQPPARRNNDPVMSDSLFPFPRPSDPVRLRTWKTITGK